MPWEENRNMRSLSPHGLKEAQGFAARGVHDLHHVECREPPPGILPSNSTPLGGDPRRASPYASESSHRPVGEPREMRPPHRASPHRYAPDALDWPLHFIGSCARLLVKSNSVVTFSSCFLDRLSDSGVR
jgi:hypothetical protein